MQVIPDLQPVFAWDGGRRIAVALPNAAAVRFALIAHGPETSACAAVWEAAAGLCIALLPEHAWHLDLVLTAADGATETIAVELDAQLAPAMADIGQVGLAPVLFDPAAMTLISNETLPASGLASLNLGSSGSGGRRWKVGPLTQLDADEAVTTVKLEPEGDGLRLLLERPGGASPVLLAHAPVDAGTLAGLPDDATGASGADAAARGFRLVAPMDDAFTVAPFAKSDTIMVLAPRHHRLAFGHGRPGTRVTLTREADGAISAALATHAYRAATATALAALSAGGQSGSSDTASDAAALAEALWKRARLAGPQASPHLKQAASRLRPGAHPLARLTLAAAAHDSAGVSPLVAAIGAALALPPGLMEEVESLPATDRAAIAAWTAIAPEVAAEAGRLRIALPDPGSGPGFGEDRDIVLALAAPDFRQQAIELAERLSAKAAGDEQRRAIADLRELADGQRGAWLTLEHGRAAIQLLRANPPPAGSATPATRLLSELKRNAAAWTEAQREGREIDLAALAERRASIPAAAIGAGLPAEAHDDIEARLPSLSAPDIILLHAYLTSAAKRQALVRAVKLAILALDDAAGVNGLSARMDRSGDPLVGMTRIGSASEQVVRELLRIPQARDALIALTGWIGACLPAAEAGHALSEQLVRNLKSYGCFLLMHAVVAESRQALDGSTPGAAALAGRLASGLVETLPRFAAAAAARAGDEIKLGLAFTNRLPSLHGKAAS